MLMIVFQMSQGVPFPLSQQVGPMAVWALVLGSLATLTTDAMGIGMQPICEEWLLIHRIPCHWLDQPLEGLPQLLELPEHQREQWG